MKKNSFFFIPLLFITFNLPTFSCTEKKVSAEVLIAQNKQFLQKACLEFLYKGLQCGGKLLTSFKAADESKKMRSFLRFQFARYYAEKWAVSCVEAIGVDQQTLKKEYLDPVKELKNQELLLIMSKSKDLKLRMGASLIQFIKVCINNAPLTDEAIDRIVTHIYKYLPRLKKFNQSIVLQYQLHQALHADDLKKLKDLIQKYGAEKILHENDFFGSHVLHYAAFLDARSCIGFILSKKNVIHANHMNDQDLLPIMLSVDDKTVSLLLQKTDINHRYPELSDATALCIVASRGKDILVKILVDDFHANINLFDKFGRTPHLLAHDHKNSLDAQAAGHIEDFLAAKKPNVNTKDSSGSTALVTSIKADSYQTVINLLALGADTAIKVAGKTPKEYAQQRLKKLKHEGNGALVKVQEDIIVGLEKAELMRQSKVSAIPASATESESKAVVEKIENQQPKSMVFGKKSFSNKELVKHLQKKVLKDFLADEVTQICKELLHEAQQEQQAQDLFDECVHAVIADEAKKIVSASMKEQEQKERAEKIEADKKASLIARKKYEDECALAQSLLQIHQAKGYSCRQLNGLAYPTPHEWFVAHRGIIQAIALEKFAEKNDCTDAQVPLIVGAICPACQQQNIFKTSADLFKKRTV